MRTLVLMALVGVMLAGCVSEEGPQKIDDGEGTQGTDGPAGPSSHPTYGFRTTHDLQTAENVTPLPAPVEAEDGNLTPSAPIVWMNPPYRPLPSNPTTLDGVFQAPEARTAGGIKLFGPLGFLGGRGGGPLYVMDLSDPEEPMVAGKIDGVPVRDADTILYPDGRLIVISTAGGSNQFATEVTNPYHPVLLSAPQTAHGNHNIAVVPGTPIVYNSGSGGTIDIMDYTDPANPVSAGTFSDTNGCHDITFFINAEENKSRAYCAGYADSEIWDISNATSPERLISIPYPGIAASAPVVGGTLQGNGAGGPVFPLSFSHLAMPNHDGTVLIMGDETGGGGINGCDAYVNAAGQTVSGPIGNLWFYDITDELNPILHGHVSPAAYDAADGTNAGTCTAHFGQILEDSGFLAMAFYSAGVALVDFRDIDNPAIVSRFDQGGNIWDVQYHSGRLYTGDMVRGMDVLLPN